MTATPLPLLITGQSGRMGRALLDAAAANPAVTVAATHDLGGDLDAAMARAACAIDFTVHSFTPAVLDAAQRHGTSLVIGTTGHDSAERTLIARAARSLPIVCASNYSIGVNTLFWLTRKAAAVLDPERFDIEVVEMHHRHKIDAPSGTARTLLEILSAATADGREPDVSHGREGIIGPRPAHQIGMHTLRGGDVVGDHTVIFAADGERLELSHKASSRQTFASGAIRAALWLAGREAGLYDMRDVLGLAD